MITVNKEFLADMNVNMDSTSLGNGQYLFLGDIHGYEEGLVIEELAEALLLVFNRLLERGTAGGGWGRFTSEVRFARQKVL